MIHPDMPAANQRAVNRALELQGARTMQRPAAEIDARMHTSSVAMDDWRRRNRDEGLNSARARRAERWPEGPRV